MEKGNGQEEPGQSESGQPPSSQPPTSERPASQPTDSAPTDTGGTPAAQPSAGGGQQANQSGPSQEATQERRREVLYQGYTEVPHPDGSVLRLDGNGGATFTDGSVALRLEGDSWVDAKTGQQSHRGHTAKADHRLRSLEMDRGLRKTMTP